MRDSRKFLLVGCALGLLLLVGVGIVAVVFFATRSVPTADQLPLNATPIMVTLASPLNDAHYPANSYIPVHVKAFGRESLFTLELWVDGALIEMQETQPDSSGRVSVEWQWVPASQGEHILLARAMTPWGHVSTSNLVHVTVTEPVRVSAGIIAGEGDTLEGLAGQYGVTPEDIQAQNPELDPAAPLIPGQAVLVPISFSPPPSAPMYSPPAAPGGAVETVGSVDPSTISLGGSSESLPAAPILAVEASGCDVNLFITDQAEGEKGFFVYRGEAGGASLQRVATLAANAGTLPLKFTDPARYGKVVYVVAAFNGAGEAPSNLAGVEVSDPACSPVQSAPGGLQWVDGKLILPQEVNAAYLYLSRDGNTWQRVPGDVESFLVPSGNAIEVESALASSGASGGSSGNLTVEAWGWQGGTLVYLGTARQIAPQSYPTELLVCGQAQGCREGVGWTTELPLDWDGDLNRQFFWCTDAQGVNQAVWQISETPFPPGPVLLDTAFTQEETVAHNGGFFWVDFSEFRDGGSSMTNPATAPPAPTSSPSPGAGFPFLTFNVYPSGIFLIPGTYYVRLIPMAGNQAVAQPSNVVKIHVGPPQEPPDVTLYQFESYYDVRILEFRPIHWAEPGACAYILENECTIPGSGWGEPIVLPAGTQVCPKSESDRGQGEPHWYESLWDFIKSGLSWVSNLYEDIKQDVVDAVGGVVCGGDETCKDVLMAGLNAGLAAMGIPPSIPNLDELMAQGITYVAAEVAAEMTGTEYLDDLYKEAADLGIPEDKAKAFVRDRVQDLVQAGLEAQAAANPNPVAGLPPECRVKGNPRGQNLPATLQVEVTRSAERGAGATEEEITRDFPHLLTISFWVQDNAHPVGDVITLNPWEGHGLPITEPLSGALFKTIVIRVPALAPGESIVIPFTPEPADYWAPGHQEALHGWSYTECDDYGCRSLTWNDWWKLYYRGELTITARVGREHSSEFSQDQCVTGPLPTSIEPFQVFCTR
jgi:LysM repeat protein